ncbi:MAG: MotA/TolQ/ExbB proton channel family protein [Planctomycetaceae bacterium]
MLEIADKLIYVAMGLATVYALFCAVLLIRKIGQKKFSNSRVADEFLDEIRDSLTERDFDGAAELCDTPPYWSKAVPQLIIVALANRQIGPTKLRQMLAEKFEREVLSDLQYRHSWIGTVVKTAPMLGLLGTVIGMILSFATIASASSQGGVNPADLADKIGVALYTTAIGLTIAIPLTILGAWVQVRISKLTDSVQEHLSEFLADLEAAMQE